jgi:cell division protein FtsW
LAGGHYFGHFWLVVGNDINVSRIRFKKQKKLSNRKLLALAFILTAVGLLAVADASAPSALNNFSDKFYYTKQQTLWAAIGLLALFLASKIHYSLWEKIATPLFVASMILLILVLIPGIGVKILGARRWIALGPFSFQPSELIKLTLAFYLARVASKDKKVLAYFLPLALVGVLIMFQPDLGTALVVGVIGMSQIFVAGINLVYFSGSIVIAGLASLLLIISSDYRRQRLMTFLKATHDPLGKSYHIRQVLLALGSGGLFGVGLGQGRQKYLFLPEATTDSIFAIIAEETGFIGAVILISLLAAFIFYGLRLVANAPDKFSKILAMGIVAWIGGQVFLNIGSMVALVPLTGIPLPFISYGGSSLVMTLFATGILLNISKYETKKKRKKK